MFTFCKPASSKKRFLPHRELNQEFSFTLFEKAEAIPTADWEAVTGRKTVFLEKEYLKIVEKGEFSKLKCRYVVVYQRPKKDKHKAAAGTGHSDGEQLSPCGILYFQIIDFKAGIFGDLFSKQVEKSKSSRLNIFEKYIDSNKEEVLLRLFTCGNNLISGEYGFLFDKKIDQVTGHEILLEIIELVSKEEKLKAAISAVLIKDFYKPLEPASLFVSKKYSDFNVEPNLFVEIPKEVQTLAQYLELFSKKYRNRAKAVFKSAEGITQKYLTHHEILKSEKSIYALYENIFDKAKFKLIKLPADYFSTVKLLYPDTFTVKGFYRNDQLVAFASSFIMPDHTLEAHYVGFDYTLNNEHDLYQNILFSMINEAITHNCKKVNLGRTAAEIKTTVGAKPEELICYIKPQNTISRIIQKPFIAFLQPGEWTPRNPFKEENLESPKVSVKAVK